MGVRFGAAVRGTTALAIAAALASTPAAEAGAWDVSGRAGVEVDGLGESFGSGSLFDTRIPPTGDLNSPDDIALSTRFRDETTRASALLDLTVARAGPQWLRVGGTVRVARTRTRGDLEASGGIEGPLGRWSISNRLYFQGGPEGYGGGADGIATLAWEQPRFPGGFRVRMALDGERSWSGEDSLVALFDYRVLRPSVQIRRRFGRSADAAVRGGYGRKWTDEGAIGSYRHLWLEVEAMRWFGLTQRWGGSLRTESRDYVDGDSLTPSYDELLIEMDGEMSGPWRLRTQVRPTFRQQQFAQDDSLIFQDYRLGELEIRLESSVRELFGRPEDLFEQTGPDWTFYVGGRAGLLRHEKNRESDYQLVAALMGFSREATGRVWFDLTGEIGRRTYRVSSSLGGLVFEGINLSLSGTDYTFYAASALAQASLGRQLRFEAFAMVDHEVHEVAADNFTLWSFTAALTRTF